MRNWIAGIAALVFALSLGAAAAEAGDRHHRNWGGGFSYQGNRHGGFNFGGGYGHSYRSYSPHYRYGYGAYRPYYRPYYRPHYGSYYNYPVPYYQPPVYPGPYCY